MPRSLRCRRTPTPHRGNPAARCCITGPATCCDERIRGAMGHARAQRCVELIGARSATDVALNPESADELIHRYPVLLDSAISGYRD
jgi:hypothetical protein